MAHLENDRFLLEIPGFSNYSRSADGESLSGHGKLWQKIEFKAVYKSIFIDEMTFHLSSGSFECGPSHIEVEVSESVHYAHIYIWMPSDQFSSHFSALRDAPLLSTSIELSFEIPKDRELKENEFCCKVTDFELDFSEYRFTPLSLTNGEIREILKPWVPAGTDSQIGGIGSELVKSLYAWLEKNPKIKIRNSYYDDHDDTYEYKEHLSKIGELIDQLRGSRYDGMSESQVESENAMKLDYWEYAGSSQESFLKKTENLSNIERHELVRRYSRYDQIWYSNRQSISELISSGKIAKIEHLSQSRLDCQYLRNLELEEVAKIYTINTWMQSPTLEWLLVDALLFTEASLFACQVNDMPEKAPIIEPSRWTNPFNTQKMTDKETLKEFQKKREHWKQQSLDMIKASDRSKDIDVFNARLMREMLYDLEKRGAIYSQAVFNILDKRIAREQSTSLS
jgi:hypothetical protein